MKPMRIEDLEEQIAALTLRAESLDRIIAEDTEREAALIAENKRLWEALRDGEEVKDGR